MTLDEIARDLSFYKGNIQFDIINGKISEKEANNILNFIESNLKEIKETIAKTNISNKDLIDSLRNCSNYVINRCNFCCIPESMREGTKCVDILMGLAASRLELLNEKMGGQ